MLPLLFFPISIPAVIGMVAAHHVDSYGRESAHFYIVLLLTYDVVFTTACLALIQDDSSRRMKQLFPILVAAYRDFPDLRLYQALVGRPTDALQGDVYRIIYYHVPSAWTAFLLFFINFIASVQYLARTGLSPEDRAMDRDRDWRGRGCSDVPAASAIFAAGRGCVRAQ